MKVDIGRVVYEEVLHCDRGSSDKVYILFVVEPENELEKYAVLGFYGKRKPGGKSLKVFEVGNTETFSLAKRMASEKIDSKLSKHYKSKKVYTDSEMNNLRERAVATVDDKGVNFDSDENDDAAVVREYGKRKKKEIAKNVELPKVICNFADGYDDLEEGGLYELVNGNRDSEFITINTDNGQVSIFSDRFGFEFA